MHFNCSRCKQKKIACQQAGFAHVFILVGVLVLAAVLGEVYYFSKAKTVKPTQIKVNQPVVSNQDSGKEEPKDNGFLQIPKITTAQQPQFNDYSNKDLGIGFSYSKELSVKGDSEGEYNKRGNGDYRKNFMGYVGYEPGVVLGAVVVLDKSDQYDINPFSVWVFDNPNNLSAENWFSKYWYYPYLWGVFDYTSKSHVALDQEATVAGKISSSKVVAYQLGSPKYVYISNNGKMYLFRVIGSIGEQILAMIKFVN